MRPLKGEAGPRSQASQDLSSKPSTLRPTMSDCGADQLAPPSVERNTCMPVTSMSSGPKCNGSATTNAVPLWSKATTGSVMPSQAAGAGKGEGFQTKPPSVVTIGSTVKWYFTGSMNFFEMAIMFAGFFGLTAIADSLRDCLSVLTVTRLSVPGYIPYFLKSSPNPILNSSHLSKPDPPAEHARDRRPANKGARSLCCRALDACDAPP